MDDEPKIEIPLYIAATVAAAGQSDGIPRSYQMIIQKAIIAAGYEEAFVKAQKQRLETLKGRVKDIIGETGINFIEETCKDLVQAAKPIVKAHKTKH
jgi:hypothetical protein